MPKHVLRTRHPGSAAPIRHVDAAGPAPASKRSNPGSAQAMRNAPFGRASTAGRRGSARKLPG